MSVKPFSLSEKVNATGTNDECGMMNDEREAAAGSEFPEI
jgi:hypothetical protein